MSAVFVLSIQGSYAGMSVSDSVKGKIPGIPDRRVSTSREGMVVGDCLDGIGIDNSPSMRTCRMK